MPIYRFLVSGEVEVEAPNVAQAWRYIRKSGRLHEVAQVLVGSGGSCPDRPVGRNIDWGQYRLSVRSLGGTKRIAHLKMPNVAVERPGPRSA